MAECNVSWHKDRFFPLQVLSGFKLTIYTADRCDRKLMFLPFLLPSRAEEVPGTVALYWNTCGAFILNQACCKELLCFTLLLKAGRYCDITTNHLSHLDRISGMRLFHTSSVRLCVVSKHEMFLNKQGFLLCFKGPGIWHVTSWICLPCEWTRF